MRLILRSLLLSVSLLTCLSSCASVEIPNLRPGITLPASGDGYRYSTLTNEEERIPKEEWGPKRDRGIILFSDDWAKLKYVLLKNCLTNKCKSTAGALDSLFYAIDDALKQLPSK